METANIINLIVIVMTEEKEEEEEEEEEARNVLRRCLNIASDGADVACDGRLFQKLALETGKVRLPTVERLNGGRPTASWLEEVDTRLEYLLLLLLMLFKLI